MDASQVYPACGHAVPSPCGTYIASLSRSQDHIYIQWTDSLFSAFTFPLQSQTAPSPGAKTLQWSADSLHLVLVSAQDVRVFSLQDTGVKRHICGGSGPLGAIAAVELVGDYIYVAWEFGTLQQWHLTTGKCSDGGHVKLDDHGRPLWAIRTTSAIKQSAKVFVTLSTAKGQESLSYRLAIEATPFQNTTATSSDTKAIAWSQDGRWLATLDTELAEQSLHIYTPDGHLFRSYPTLNKTAAPAIETGFQAMRWSRAHLALASARRATVLLDSRTLSHKCTLAPGPCEDLTGWQESFGADNDARWYSFVTRNAIPTAAISPCATSIEFNSDGTLLATMLNSERSTAKSIAVWSLVTRRPCAVLLLQSPIKIMAWHPSRSDLIMIHCHDSSTRLWSVSGAEAPRHVTSPFSSGREASTRTVVKWAVKHSSTDSDDAILVTDKKAGWTLIWPNGRSPVKTPDLGAEDDVTEQEDSLFDILSGKKPLPSLLVPGFEHGTPTGVEDTFGQLKQQRQALQVSPGLSEMF